MGMVRGTNRIMPGQQKEKKKITRELVSLILARKPKMCNFLEWKDTKVVYKRSVRSTADQRSPMGPAVTATCYQVATVHEAE